jgi:hypothetical protein
MTDRELLELVEEGMKVNAPDSPEYIVCAALRARLAQPEPAQCDGGQCGIGGYCKECPKTQLEQKPVAWGLQQQFEAGIGTTPVSFKRHDEFGFVVPLYTAPPQRKWQGLTDEEMFAALVQADPLTKRLAPGFEYFARAIEAKLKEKNA